MRTLYERLKPEVKSFLHLQEELYPFVIPYITGSLKEAYSILDLKYDVVLEFSLYANLDDFLPSTVFSQFEES